MDILPILAARRDGRPHTEAELRFLALGAANGSIPDYQLSAWLMAAYFNPLSDQETAWLTVAMAESGERLDLTGLPKPWVDKHSTGGVGDKTTIVLLPILAACGLTVVKMSGRGLGITGGTVDKLASIPGFRVDLTPDEMKAQAKRIGVALTGQTPNLAPADKTLYALRDVTETVESIPLIVSSILSKKIAGGAETVVIDVKCGSGAFVKTVEKARQLARLLEATGRLSGLNVRTSISDMSQPLGAAIGNALEISEALDILQGNALSEPSLRFKDLCLHFAVETLVAAGLHESEKDARQIATDALASGRSLEKARDWIEAQGGDAGVIENHHKLPQAPVTTPFVHEGAEGWISKLDAETVGRAVIGLGGGRHDKDDEIDPSVGIVLGAQVGSEIRPGQTLATVHARNETEAVTAINRLRQAIEVSQTPVETPSLFLAAE